MAYTFNGSENKITKLLPAYIFNYADDKNNGLFLFIKYLTNYIETANEALDTICSKLNVNSDNTFILDILAKKLGVEIPTTITSVEDKQTVLKGKIMTISSTGCAQALIDTIYGLYPDWHNYDSFGTPIEVGNTIYKLFCNTTETPNISELGWDNADETTTTTDTDGFETVTKILNVLVSTTGPVVQLVYKKSNGLEGYSVIVHYTTEKDDANVISYKDKNTCDIEDLVDSNNMITAISPEIDEVRSFVANQKTFYAISNNTYNYPDVKDMYYNSYRTIRYTNNWENYNWQNLPNDISKGDIWQDNAGNIYASDQSLQCKLNKQTFTWEPMFWKGLTSFYRDGIWTDGKKMYYSGRIWNDEQSKWEDVNYELTDNYTWIPKTWKGLDTLIKDGGGLRGGDIWTDGEKIYCSTQLILSGGTTKYYNYVLNPDTSTWSPQTWEGLTDIQTGKLFHYKEQVLYCVYFDSDFTTTYYTLDIDTNKWEQHNWPDGIYINPVDIWSDGNDYYYLSREDRYKLNQTSFTWEPITWTGLDDISISTGRLIWHFDNNIFYEFTKRLVTVNSDKVIVDRKRLDKNYQNVFTTDTISSDGDFQRIKFNDPDNNSEILPDNYISGIDIWNNGSLVYYTRLGKSLRYNKQLNQFENKIWTVPEGVELLDGRNIYNIDDNIYYSYVKTYDPNETPVNLQLTSGSTWIEKKWEDADIRDGNKVWKTKDNVYYDITYKFIDGSEFITLSVHSFNPIIKLNNVIWYFAGDTYRLDKTTNTWENLNWIYDSKTVSLYGMNVWSDGTSVYYSDLDKQYILNTANLTCTKKEWGELYPGLGTFVWSDGINTYYDSNISKNHWQLVNGVWQNHNWVGLDGTHNTDWAISADGIWTDGTDIYYSYYSDNVSKQYKLFDKNKSEWVEKVWLGTNDLNGYNIWKYNDNIYYSEGKLHYRLDVKNSKWEPITWQGLNNFSGQNIWSDGNNTYYSTYNSTTEDSAQYMLVDTTWVKIVWEYAVPEPDTANNVTWSNIPDNFDPINIWHIGDTTYYSKGTTHRIINEDTMSFDDYTEWKGVDSFSGEYIWESNNNIYYTPILGGSYILDVKTHTWSPKNWISNDVKDSKSDIMSRNYIWSDGIRTYYSSNYVLNDYTDSVSVECSFTDTTLSIKPKLTRKYTVQPVYSIRLQAPSYALDMIKLPNNLLGWYSPDGIESPVIEVVIINNVTDKVPTSFEIIREKYQNEWGRYIDKDDDFNPIINKAVSVIDTSSLLHGAQNMHYEVIIGGVDKDGNPGPDLTASQKDIITKYLIPKFLGVSYEVKFK